jgi:hypothetical protein
MHRYTKLLLASLTATALLAMAVSSANATRLRISEQSFRVTWTSLRLTNTANTNTVLCPVTLEGSFHSATISKVANALIGYITRASVRGGSGREECIGGTATVLGERLPWHVRYRGFTGTLPTIASVITGLVGASWQISEPGSTCRATTTSSEPAIGNIRLSREGVAESLSPEINARITLEGGFFGSCTLARGAFSEESQTLTGLGTTARITVSLI